MRIISRRSGQAGANTHRRAVAGWAGALALTLGLAAAPAAAQAPEAPIINRATGAYHSGGTPGSLEASVSVRLGRFAGVRIAPPQTAVLQPGESRVFTHLLENLGSGTDRFQVTAALPSGWTAELFLDVNGDGALGPDDAPLAGVVELDRGAAAALFLRVTVPADAGEVADAPVTVQAASVRNPGVAGAVTNHVTVRLLAPALAIAKAVDRADATTGDTLRYTISFANTGQGPAAGVLVADALPAGAGYVPGSMVLDGMALTDALDGDPGAVTTTPDGRTTVRLSLAVLGAGAAGTLQFRVVVTAAESGSLANVATLTASGFELVSAPAVTRVGIPVLAVQKELLGPDTIRVGGEVTYRISWANTSATPVYGAVVTDTLPAPLAFVTASGNVVAQGQVVRWTLGDLAGSRSGSLTLVARAVAAADAVVNQVALRGANAPAVRALAAPLRVRGDTASARPGRLEIAKRAGTLEARLGDAVVFQIELRNAGEVPLAGIVVRDILPAGVQFVEGTVGGADSTRLDGGTLTLWVAGPLAPGAVHALRYSVAVVAPGRARTLVNRAVAEAEGAQVVSDTALAEVRLRDGFGSQARTVIGKVWVDVDGDGRQGPGETGVHGVEIWSADGEVATTDAHGRYSFRNLRPGTHALRLDTLGLPRDVRLARPGDMIASVRMDGWTTGRADFRVVPVAGREDPAGLGGGQDAAAPAPPAPARAAVAPMRTAEEREQEGRRAVLEGARVRILTPADGSVLGSNRLSVVVQGEAGAAVRLFRGEEQIAEGTLRPDGRGDFAGIEIARGPQRLRVWMRNAWGREVWDSVAVHRSGTPERFEVVGEMETLRAEARLARPVEVRVLDAWGVPVPGGVATVEADGATVEGRDADGSSVGLQLAAGEDGILVIGMRAGERVGPGELRLQADRAGARVPLRVLPTTRRLIATGAAQAGVGAASEAHGALLVRGALDDETSLSVSIDSRRGADEDFFGRGYDPTEEGRYPTLGDASERRVLSSATQKVSARLERGYDWMEFGDVDMSLFGGDGRLASYRRALTGLAGRVTTGPVTWNAYGSVTDQVLSMIQLRGDGTSGPYRFGTGIRPGTDRITVEVRAAENAAAVMAREELRRFTDYQIDYASGEVVFFRPIPASDGAGNPVFVVGMLERRSGGEARFTAGARMELDAGRLLGLARTDSLGVFLLGVHDGESGGAAVGSDLLGSGFRFRRGGLHGGAELLRAELDSAALAGRALLGWTAPGERARLEAEWTQVGSGFQPGTDPRLSAGLREIRLSGDVAVSERARVRLMHARQRFDGYGVERQNTTLGAESELAGRRVTAEAGIAADQVEGASSSILTGRVRLPVTERLDAWLEGAHALAGGSGLSRPSQAGVGLSYRLTSSTQAELLQRWVGLGGDSAAVSVTSVKLRTNDPFGGQIWAGLDRAGAGQGATSGLLGWSPRARLGGGWAVHGTAERRFGLDRAPLIDPVRALPFAQVERDRWSIGAGLHWAPADTTGGRFNLRGEVYDSRISRGHRGELTGEAPLGASAAVLTRLETWSERRELGTGAETSRRDRALLGLALRPVASDAVNVLGRIEWRNNVTPEAGSQFGGAGAERRLLGATDLVWSPTTGTEVAGRYALRWTLGDDRVFGGSVASVSHFVGARAEQRLTGLVRTRLDGRLLMAAGGAERWSLAPSLLITPGGLLEVEGGYRLGTLRDADFAAHGGSGVFATVGVRFSEGVIQQAAGFWRERLARAQ